MKISLKLLASFLSAAVLVATIGIVAYFDFIKIEQLIDRLNEITF